ncbi:carbonic anhydrase [Streptomyces carpinensis]|uniref:Carbonic anhydrase n=2 Tax=Streptomyces carpinensis TaxID=66369 RepID=A0ABV1W1F1_9ACTN
MQALLAPRTRSDPGSSPNPGPGSAHGSSPGSSSRPDTAPRPSPNSGTSRDCGSGTSPNSPAGAGNARTPLGRWLRHGLPSLERMADAGRPVPWTAEGRPAAAVERLCLTNVVQQLEHLRAHESVARALREGTLELHGMYFHVAEAQAYLLTGTGGNEVFVRVEATEDLPSPA